MGSDQGWASLLPELWYICHEDDDDDGSENSAYMMMMTLSMTWLELNCEYVAIVNLLQPEGDLFSIPGKRMHCANTVGKYTQHIYNIHNICIEYTICKIRTQYSTATYSPFPKGKCSASAQCTVCMLGLLNVNNTL